MKTNYSTITKDFVATVKSYCVYALSNNHKDDILSKPLIDNQINGLEIKNWTYKPLTKLFNITGIKTTPPLELLNKKNGIYPYVTI